MHWAISVFAPRPRAISASRCFGSLQFGGAQQAEFGARFVAHTSALFVLGDESEGKPEPTLAAKIVLMNHWFQFAERTYSRSGNGAVQAHS